MQSSVTVNPDPLLTRQQAAEFLGVNVRTLANWACNGKVNLPFVKVGHLVKYRLSALEQFLEENTVSHSK